MDAKQLRSNRIRFNTTFFWFANFYMFYIWVPFFVLFRAHFLIFFHNLFFPMVQDLRKKGSARRFMFINSTLEQEQKKRKRPSNISISRGCFWFNVGQFQRIYLWLIIRFDVTRSELVIPYRDRIKVDDHTVQKILGIPMGEEHIDYAKNSFSDTYE